LVIFLIITAFTLKAIPAEAGEPSFDGKSLSESTNATNAENSAEERRIAIRELVFGIREKSNASPPVLVLLRYLNDPDPRVAASSAKYLSYSKGESRLIVPALTNALQNTNSSVRAEAVYSLRVFQGEGRIFADSLLRALSDPDANVRGTAASVLVDNPAALGALGDMGEKARPAVPVLVRALRCETEAAEAAESLGKLQMEPSIVIPALDRCLGHRRSGLAAAVALGKYGKKAAWVAQDLIDALQDSYFQEYVQKTAKTIGALDDSHFQERVAITNALLQILPEPVDLPRVINLSQANNPREKNTNPSIFRSRDTP
jgi:HEAT repeat protein